MTFNYTASNIVLGCPVSGTIDAADNAAAQASLVSQGCDPASIVLTPVATPPPAPVPPPPPTSTSTLPPGSLPPILPPAPPSGTTTPTATTGTGTPTATGTPTPAATTTGTPAPTLMVSERYNQLVIVLLGMLTVGLLVLLGMQVTKVASSQAPAPTTIVVPVGGAPTTPSVSGTPIPGHTIATPPVSPGTAGTTGPQPVAAAEGTQATRVRDITLSLPPRDIVYIHRGQTKEIALNPKGESPWLVCDENAGRITLLSTGKAEAITPQGAHIVLAEQDRVNVGPSTFFIRELTGREIGITIYVK